MVGNQIEEGLLRDLSSPAHRDRSPILVGVVLGIWAGGTWLIWSSSLPFWMHLCLQVLVLVAGLAVAYAMRKAALANSIAERAAFEKEVRAERSRSRLARVAEARKAGEFDRWERE